RFLPLLTPKPLQALVAVFALGQGFGSVRFWPHRKKDSLKGISARQALDVVTAFEGDTATLMQGDKPSLEVKRNRVMDEGQWIARSKHPGGDIDAIHVPTLADEVNLLDDIVTRGRRLTYIRNYPD